MTADRTEAVSALLVETMDAHGRYEETELQGVYDEEWPEWYAAWAVEHGLGDLIGHPISADRLARFLAASNAEFERTEPKPTEAWAPWTARRITAEL
jgi:hypothetical protein